MLFLDLETFSELDLRVVALDRYASHPSTRILMCAYAVDDGPMEFWQEGDDDTNLRRLIAHAVCVPWNKSFEETLLEKVWKLTAHDWDDAMIRARYAGLPSRLKDCGRVPYFTGISVSTKETLLINKFCKPGKGGVIRDRTTDPEDWAAFCDYCKRDVEDTRMLYKWLVQHFPLPDRVCKSWKLDQKINRRGMPVDLAFVVNAKMEADRLQEIAHEDLKKLTGLDNPNSVTQLLAWVTARGYTFNGLGKELVKKFVDDEEMPEGEAKDALRLRLSGAKASVKKLGKILETISADRRLREQYNFYKAHTGRWAGKGAQLQNLKAPRTKEEKALVSVVVDQLERGLQVASLDALSLSLRPAICAPKGKKVVLADFKSVENRVLAWLAGCDAMLEVYRQGKDPYIDFASRLNDIPYDAVSAEMRQIAKPGTLGCGFGLGGGQEQRRGKCKQSTCKYSGLVANESPEGEIFDCPKCFGRTYVIGGLFKTGLWRYAEMMGIEITQQEAHRQVNEFRQAFMEVCELWYWLEEAFVACASTKRPQRVGRINFRWADPALRIILPSGRELVYCNAWGYKSRDHRGFKTVEMGFEGVKGNAWCRQTTYGGRLCENVVQAVALDLLVDALERTEQDAALEIVGHTHDEGITLADENDVLAVTRLEGYFSTVDPWADGLPMGADGYEGRRYSK